MKHRIGSLAVAAASILGIVGSASAEHSRDARYIRFHEMQVVVTDARVTAVSNGVRAANTAIVGRGASITVQGTYNIAFSSNPADYTFCPSCFIQEYIAWSPAAASAGATPVNHGLWSGQNFAPGISSTSEGATSGVFTFTTTAPTTAGEYYISVGEGLDFGFNPAVTGQPGFDLSLGVVGSPVYNSFLISVVNAPPAPCAGDANGDGTVNFADISTVLANFGSACP